MNLCKLPVEQQNAIQADKVAWYEAHKLFRDKPRQEIVKHLESLPKAEKEDLRRRLNVIQDSKKWHM